MHEFTIAQSVLATVLDELSRYPKARLLKVRLQVGDLSAVVSEALASSWQILTPDTPADGASLIIKAVPVTAVCRSCDALVEGLEAFLAGCLRCGPSTLDLQTGKELEIDSMEIDDDQKY